MTSQNTLRPPLHSFAVIAHITVLGKFCGKIYKIGDKALILEM